MLALCVVPITSSTIHLVNPFTGFSIYTWLIIIESSIQRSIHVRGNQADIEHHSTVCHFIFTNCHYYSLYDNLQHHTKYLVLHFIWDYDLCFFTLLQALKE